MPCLPLLGPRKMFGIISPGPRGVAASKRPENGHGIRAQLCMHSGALTCESHHKSIQQPHLWCMCRQLEMLLAFCGSSQLSLVARISHHGSNMRCISEADSGSPVDFDESMSFIARMSQT